MEAMIAVRKMNLLCPSVSAGSRELIRQLRARKKFTNAVIGTTTGIGVLVALFAAGFFFGPAALAGSALYASITAGGTSGTALAVAGGVAGSTAVISGGTLAVKVPWEDGRFEKSGFSKPPYPMLAFR